MRYEVGNCRLREILIKSGMTQNKLAFEIGVTESMISEYVNNKHIMTLRIARNISTVLKCDIIDLYEWIEVE